MSSCGIIISAFCYCLFVNMIIAYHVFLGIVRKNGCYCTELIKYWDEPENQYENDASKINAKTLYQQQIYLDSYHRFRRNIG